MQQIQGLRLIVSITLKQKLEVVLDVNGRLINIQVGSNGIHWKCMHEQPFDSGLPN